MERVSGREYLSNPSNIKKEKKSLFNFNSSTLYSFAYFLLCVIFLPFCMFFPFFIPVSSISVHIFFSSFCFLSFFFLSFALSLFSFIHIYLLYLRILFSSFFSSDFLAFVYASTSVYFSSFETFP